MAPAAAQETEEEGAQREAEHEERMAEYRAEQERKEEERKAESERQQKEYEAEQARREKQRKARLATFDRILEQAPAVFTATQLRLFLRLVVYIDPYSFLEEVAIHFAGDDENHEQTEQEIVLSALDKTADEKLTSFALRLALTDHLGLPATPTPTCFPKPRRYSLHPMPNPRKPVSLKRLQLSSNLPRRRQQRRNRKPPNPSTLAPVRPGPLCLPICLQIAAGEPPSVSPGPHPAWHRPPLAGCAAEDVSALSPSVKRSTFELSRSCGGCCMGGTEDRRA